MFKAKVTLGGDIPTKVRKTPRNHHHGHNPVRTRSVSVGTPNVVNGILPRPSYSRQRFGLQRTGGSRKWLGWSWRHINLLGECDFSGGKLEDSVRIKPQKWEA
jgi:hypothetical protein